MAGFERAGSRIEVWPSQGGLFWLLVRDLGIFAVSVGLIVFFFGPSVWGALALFLGPNASEAIILGAIVIFPFVGPLRRAVYDLYRLAWLKPSLIIGPEGLVDKASAFGVGLVKWEEIKEIYPFKYGRHRYVGIVPLYEEGILARQNPLARALGKVNRSVFRMQAASRLQATMIWIPERYLSVFVEELIPRIEQEGSTYEEYWKERVNDRSETYSDGEGDGGFIEVETWSSSDGDDKDWPSVR